MSHSWHDEPGIKYTSLEHCATVFQREHRRAPTFWLGKVCIDQSNIGDGLRVLPVNVMACNRMMVLCGDTYQHRLWCIWEFFLLFAFARMDQAVERLLLVPLSRGHGESSVADQLAHFSVMDARCYDPNAETRLRAIIAALGEDRFNNRIRALGVALSLRREISAASSSRHDEAHCDSAPLDHFRLLVALC